MDAEAVDRGFVLAEAVEHGLAPPPVVTFAPIGRERLETRKRYALGPIVDGLPVRPSRGVQTPVQIVQRALGYREREWNYRGIWHGEGPLAFWQARRSFNRRRSWARNRLSRPDRRLL